MRSKQICAIRLGFETFILPMVDGLKIVDIMSRAMAAEPVFNGRKLFRLNDRNEVRRVDLQLVRHDQIDMGEIITPALKRLQIGSASKGDA